MHHPKQSTTEWIGWYGVAAILVAFLAQNLGWIGPNHSLYLFLNISGSISVAIDAYKQKNLQPVVLNIFWCLISLIGLVRFWIY